MPIYRVVKEVVQVYEVRADDDDAAIRLAYDAYSWDIGPDKKITNRTTERMTFSCERVRIDPPCGIDDGGERCPRAGTVRNESMDAWVCAEHAKTISGAGLPTDTIPAPAPSLSPEEIPF